MVKTELNFFFFRRTIICLINLSSNKMIETLSLKILVYSLTFYIFIDSKNDDFKYGSSIWFKCLYILHFKIQLFFIYKTLR